MTQSAPADSVPVEIEHLDFDPNSEEQKTCSIPIAAHPHTNEPVRCSLPAVKLLRWKTECCTLKSYVCEKCFTSIMVNDTKMPLACVRHCKKFNASATLIEIRPL